MRNAQRGVSIMGLLMVLVILIVVALLAMKIIPSFLEFRTVKKAIERDRAQRAQSPGGRAAGVRRSAPRSTTSTASRASDLEITEEGNQMVIAFAYRKEMPLFANVGLYIDFAANSKDSRGAGSAARALGHRFADARAARAGAHAPQLRLADHNERLEFLGDGVLGCVSRRRAVRALSASSPKAS